MSLSTPKQQLLLDENVQQAIQAATAAMQVYAVTYLETEDNRFPHQTALRLKQELNELSDPAKYAELLRRITELSGPGAEGLANLYRRQTLLAWEPAKVASLKLLTMSKTVAIANLEQAQRAEAEFFASWGVEPQATEVSKRYARLVAEIDSLISSLGANGNDNPPDPFHGTALANFYGVRIGD